mmetsp:Transcript_38686/g.111798  ORF Transcript_38686/g.111798 Transcript_38686/m.111798 type:complete len:1194 (-) Transcript_38686:204-3785(-)
MDGETLALASLPDTDDLRPLFVEVQGCPAPLEIVRDFDAEDTTEGGRSGEDQPEFLDANGVKGRLIKGSLDFHNACIVQTFDGIYLNVPAAHLQAFKCAEPEVGGFDVCWPSPGAITEDPEWHTFGASVASTMARKGYCVAQMFATTKARETALDDLLYVTDWQLPVTQWEPAYLGSFNRDKYSPLSVPNNPGTPGAGLRIFDDMATDAIIALEPFAEQYLNFQLWGRLTSYVRTPLTGKAEEEQLRPKPLGRADYHGGRVIRHLNFLERRKVLVLMVIHDGGEPCEVRLHHIGDLTVTTTTLRLSSNKVLFLRGDLYGYSLASGGNSLALQAWLLAPPPMATYGDPNVAFLPLQLHDGRVHAMSMANRYPGDALGPTCYWSFFCGGGDSNTKVPVARWDMDIYYCEDRHIDGVSYAMHGGFCSDAMVTEFDNDFFGIASAEAARMSPGQRVVLETGFETLHRAGHTKVTARGMDCGVFLGDSGNDWAFLIQGQDAYRILSQSNAITGSRLSHLLGLRGPVSTTDTACSSSLVAVCLAHQCLRRTAPYRGKSVINTKCNTTLALGCGLLLHPRYFILYSGPGMLSPRGRCFTYDSSADGYARGEGCGGLMLTYGESEDDAQGMLACLAGSSVNQDGRSASMTAPNGPAQQTCIRTSMDESQFTPSNITVAECHGTGTALGDPIEVSALRAVMESRSVPLLNTSAKTNIGHLEAAAGMAGVIKCILMLTASTAPANVHLRFLNPHMDTNGYPVFFETEMGDHGANTGLSGVSSFGFGGTNARGDLWARCLRGARASAELSTAKWLEKRNMFFQRVFHYGSPGPHQNDKVYIMGTWDCFSNLVLMDPIAGSSYAITVVLGESRCEQFRFAVNEDSRQEFHPDRLCAPRTARVEGPDGDGERKTWLIDGRADQVPAWTMYKVTFEWGFDWAYGEYKKVAWEAMEQVAPHQMRLMLHQHSYGIRGTWTSWAFRILDRCQDEPGVWFTAMRLGVSGREEFQLARDNDITQSIYPAAPLATRSGIPIRGPDCHGNGKNWLIVGSPGDVFRIRLRVCDGDISLSLTAEDGVAKMWRNVETNDWMRYYVVGSWNDWTFGPMKRDVVQPHLHRMSVRIGAQGFEEFHIVIEKDWALQLYPDLEKSQLYEGELCGPDCDGHGFDWLMRGDVGAEYEIILDLHEKDRRRAVTWREATQDRIARE